MAHVGHDLVTLSLNQRYKTFPLGNVPHIRHSKCTIIDLKKTLANYLPVWIVVSWINWLCNRWLTLRGLKKKLVLPTSNFVRPQSIYFYVPTFKRSLGKAICHFFAAWVAHDKMCNLTFWGPKILLRNL
jgi:hypothetical protein